MKVVIRFRPMFQSALLTDIKIYTSRTRRMGKVGDVFEAFGQWFRILEVRRERLGYIAQHLWMQEGCTNSRQFAQIWAEIHPGSGFRPEDSVWLHKFERIALS